MEKKNFNFGILLSNARQMENHFRAFKEINELVQFITSSEQVVREAELRLEKVQAEINEKQRQAAEMQDLTAEIGRLKKEQTEVERKLSESLEIERQRVAGEIKKIEMDREEAQNKLNDVRAELERIKGRI